MSQLSDASENQFEELYRESHLLWGGGLSLESYLGLWRELRDSRWGRDHARLLVWTGERRQLLSSLKLYRPLLRVDGEDRVSRYSSRISVGRTTQSWDSPGCPRSSRRPICDASREKIRSRRRRRAEPMLIDLAGSALPATISTPPGAYLPLQGQF